MKKLAKLLSVFLLSISLIPSAYAASYKVIIKKITPQADTGDVILLFKPGKNEDGFNGKGKGVLLGTDLGTNKLLSVVLVAVSMQKEVIIEVDTIPSSGSIQTIASIGLAP